MRLGDYLSKHGMKQSEFAALAGMSQGTVSDIVTERIQLSVMRALRIIKASNGEVTIDDLPMLEDARTLLKVTLADVGAAVRGVNPTLWTEILCPECGCLLHSDGGFEDMEFGIGGIYGTCDKCETLLAVDLAGDGPHYVVSVIPCGDPVRG